jgi:tetrahedral aminopeptidase
MNFDLLKELCETPGVPSREERIREVARRELTPLVDDLRVDAMGNLIAHKRGSGPKVMIAAHMDEIGFLVKHIDDKGFVRLQPLGGWDPRAMVAQRVWVHGFAGTGLLGALQTGNKPSHTQTPEERNKVPTLADFYVDLGLGADEIKKSVQVGDPVTMVRTTERMGNRVMSKTLDDRVGLFVMIEAIRACKNPAAEIFAVATTQEEVGCRGAETAAYAIQPHVGVALDVTLAADVPGVSEQDQVTQLGKGVALKIMDSFSLSHPVLVRQFQAIAQAHGIAHQMEVLPLGGTDAGPIQRSQGGVPAITLSIPTRYVHTPNEMADMGDIEACIALLAKYLEEAPLPS